MSTDTEKKEIKLSPSIIEAMVKLSKEDRTKLVEKLWEYCRDYPNDTDLGRNLRKFILLESMSK